MDLTLDGSDQALIDAARAWVTRRCPRDRIRELDGRPDLDADLWREMVALDWPGLGVPEDVGGTGSGLFQLALVAEALGEGAVPSPLLTSVTLATLPLAWAGAPPDLLADLAAGRRVGTLALLEPGMRDEWSPVGVAGDVPLHGVKVLVAWGASVEVIVVATTGGLRVCDGAASGLRRGRHDSFAGEPLVTIELDRAPAIDVGPADARALLARALDSAAVAQFAYAVGLAATMLELSVRHAQQRHQFGRPIGSFQAVAHRCADMRADVDACRVLAYQAAWSLDRAGADGDHSEVEVAAALAYGKDALRRVARHAHQVHGALGFSTEHDLHLFSRRAKAFELLWGSARRHRERLAGAMGLR